MRYFTFFFHTKPQKSGTAQSGPDTFQVLHSHLWRAAPALDSAGFDFILRSKEYDQQIKAA